MLLLDLFDGLSLTACCRAVAQFLASLSRPTRLPEPPQQHWTRTNLACDGMATAFLTVQQTPEPNYPCPPLVFLASSLFESTITPQQSNHTANLQQWCPAVRDCTSHSSHCYECPSISGESVDTGLGRRSYKERLGCPELSFLKSPRFAFAVLRFRAHWTKGKDSGEDGLREVFCTVVRALQEDEACVGQVDAGDFSNFCSGS